MEISLVDKVAIVTGASHGLGREIAGAYAQAGAHVVLASRKQVRSHVVHRRIPTLNRAWMRIMYDQ